MIRRGQPAGAQPAGEDADGAQKSEDRPRHVRAWYGLPAEIVVERDDWHLVRVGPLPWPHPPLVNRLIRRGLPRQERLRLSYLHELGHLQTLPLALAHAVWLWRRRRSGPGRLLAIGIVAALIGHGAAWELAAEGYVKVKIGDEYRCLSRKHSNPWRVVFWVGMAGLALLGTRLPPRGKGKRR